MLQKGHFKQRQYHRGGLFCVTTGQRTSWTFQKEFLTYNITQNNICNNSNALISYKYTLPDFYFEKWLRLVFLLQKMLLIFIQLNFINATGAICFIYCFHHHMPCHAMTTIFTILKSFRILYSTSTYQRRKPIFPGRLSYFHFTNLLSRILYFISR